MKACVVQLKYSLDYLSSDRCFEEILKAFDQCDDSLDLIVFPEYCDVPALAKTKEQFFADYEKYNEILLKKASDTARRCRAHLFVNALYNTGTGIRNTTYAFDKSGEVAGRYFKQHLTKSEEEKGLDSGYTYEPSSPYILELDGIRYGFLTCYDFYFYEIYSAIAKERPDIIIGCSHQRTDTHDATETICRFCAYNCNAYVIRASVSMDEDSCIGGGSMVVAPDSRVLLNMKSRVGLEAVEFDYKEKYYKPAGFGNAPTSHFDYVEKGRRPQKYRPAGYFVSKDDGVASYPRICVKGGLADIAPKSSIVAFGGAIALDVDEIGFDLWYTKDNEPVIVHDKELCKICNGDGLVYERTYDELLSYDFGYKFLGKFKGLKILTLEELLRKFACQVIMNINIKCDSTKEPGLKKTIDIIRKYNCEKHIYFTSDSDELIGFIKGLAPEISCCVGGEDTPCDIVERAVTSKAQKILLDRSHVTKELTNKAHNHGIICCACCPSDENEIRRLIDSGVDTVITVAR